MITKQAWDAVRHTEELPTHIIYDYYVEHMRDRKHIHPFSVFEKKLPEFIAQWEHIPRAVGDRMVVVTYAGIVEKVVDFYEKQFYG